MDSSSQLEQKFDLPRKGASGSRRERVGKREKKRKSRGEGRGEREERARESRTSCRIYYDRS